MTRDIRTEKVEYMDPEHIYINGTQWICLERFLELKKEIANQGSEETRLLQVRAQRLEKENQALATLLNLKKEGDQYVSRS